jgi:hypothetical protein
VLSKAILSPMSTLVLIEFALVLMGRDSMVVVLQVEVFVMSDPAESLFCFPSQRPGSMSMSIECSKEAVHRTHEGMTSQSKSPFLISGCRDGRAAHPLRRMVCKPESLITYGSTRTKQWHPVNETPIVLNTFNTAIRSI